MTIGERIKARRKETGLKAENIAKELGISKVTYYRWENGDIKKIDVMQFVKLCDVLNADPNSLLIGADMNPKKILNRIQNNDWRMKL